MVADALRMVFHGFIHSVLVVFATMVLILVVSILLYFIENLLNKK